MFETGEYSVLNRNKPHNYDLLNEYICTGNKGESQTKDSQKYPIYYGLKKYLIGRCYRFNPCFNVFTDRYTNYWFELRDFLNDTDPMKTKSNVLYQK